MTPDEARSAAAALFTQHAATMQSIADKGVAHTEEWAAVGARVVDQFRSGEVTVRGLIEQQLDATKEASRDST